jgi:catechol 2,3-dioxygenase-like lactoylglutathione lyase family enzyme
MLKDGRVATRLPAQDLERAKAFYADKLGLHPVEEREGGLRYVSAAGEFALFESAGAPSGDHTQMGWEVDDIEATVTELRAREWSSRSTTVPTSEGNMLGIGQPLPGK